MPSFSNWHKTRQRKLSIKINGVTAQAVRMRGLKAGGGVPKLESRGDDILDRGNCLSKGIEVIR